MYMSRYLSTLGLALALAGCASFGATGDGDAGLDAANTDGGQNDAAGDALETGDLADLDVIEPGGFGDPCTGNEDCRSGFCIEGLEGELICTEFCSDTCPDETYECRLIENSGGDLVSICFPPYDDLCRACEFDRQCGGLADQCVQLVDGDHCGRDCATDPECPPGFYCETFSDGAQQCIPASQTCTGCVDGDGDLYGNGPGCLGLDCDETDIATYEGALELCDGRDNDCDLDFDEDFDITTDPLHCGGCGMPCELENAQPGCSGGICFILQCDPLYYDLNGSPADGCEYLCEHEDLLVEDVPDYRFRDTNCDGIDGDPANAVFLSPTGDDLNLGTPDSPFRTLQFAMEHVLANEFVSAIYAAEGQYFGLAREEGGFHPIELRDGVSIYGGYEDGTWRRSAGNVTRFTGSSPAAIARGFASVTEYGQIDFDGENGATTPNGDGSPSIGLVVENTAGLTLTGCTSRGGNGGQGAAGDPGVTGLPGTAGGTGGTGEVDSSGTCSSNPAPATGSSGSSPCGSTGGAGGAAARSSSAGATGGAGSGTGAGAGGGGGSGGSDDWLGSPTSSGTNGGPGTSGASPDASPTGPAGSADDIVFDANDIWVSARGETGSLGAIGGGAGGGGGGGGATGSCGGFIGTCDGYGGAGGGGGGGGCGGTGAAGGGSGGGSFGLYAIDSLLAVSHSTLEGGDGGAAGDGGTGGSGGQGGDPGFGGPSSCNGGSGGPGGLGGRGGRGGQGGGGAGGPSYSAISLRSTIEIDDTELRFGSGGPGGNEADEGPTGEVRVFE